MIKKEIFTNNHRAQSIKPLCFNNLFKIDDGKIAEDVFHIKNIINTKDIFKYIMEDMKNRGELHLFTKEEERNIMSFLFSTLGTENAFILTGWDTEKDIVQHYNNISSSKSFEYINMRALPSHKIIKIGTKDDYSSVYIVDYAFLNQYKRTLYLYDNGRIIEK